MVCSLGHCHSGCVKIILLFVVAFFWSSVAALGSDYAQLSGASNTNVSVTTTPANSGLAITTTPAAQPYNFAVEFAWDWNSTPSDDRLVLGLYEDGSLIWKWVTSPGYVNQTIYGRFSAQYTPTNASHAYVIKLSCLSGSGSVRLWTISPSVAFFLISPETDVTGMVTYVLEIECLLCILLGFVLVWAVLSRLL